MDVLIIGASGRLGRETTAALRSAGHRAVVTSSKPRTGFTTLNLESVLSGPDIFSLIRKVDLVIYMAADKNNYNLDSKEFLAQLNVNAINPEMVATKCLEASKVFMYLSGAIVYANHYNFANKESSPFATHSISSYQSSKISAENQLKNMAPSSNGIIIVRPSTIYGGDQLTSGLIESKCQQAVSLGAIELHQPENERFNFIHARDLADFIILLAENNLFGPSNVSNLESYNVRQVVEVIAQLTGATIKSQTESNYSSPGEKYALDISRMLGFGWSPKIDLNEGIARILQQLST
jgi:nucleoside-diphosphate-sugar epimerase